MASSPQNWDWPPDANVVSPAEHGLVGTMPALMRVKILDKTALFSVEVDTTEEQEECCMYVSSVLAYVATPEITCQFNVAILS